MAYGSRRGQGFSWLVLVLAVVVAVVYGAATFAALASVDLMSGDPFRAALGWASVAGVVAVAALVVLAMAVYAFVWSRPRAVAGFATAVAVVLPIVAGVFAFRLGVMTHGPETALLVLKIADRLGINFGPLRDLLIGLVGSS